MAEQLSTPRPVTDDEWEAYLWATEVAFGEHADPGFVADERAFLPLDRTLAVWEGDRIVGAAGAYPLRLSVPGGTMVPVGGVTGVAVLPTHRRRGVMRSIMEVQLADIARRGEPAAVLNASEAGIYGRFGYGVAEEQQRLEVVPSSLRWARPPAPRPVRMVRQGEAAAVVAPIYDAAARARPGALSRSEAWWGAVLGPHERWKGGGKVFVVVVEADDPALGGYAIYRTRPTDAFRTAVQVRELVAADPEVEALLWQVCTGIDLADVVEVEARPLDDPVRWRLADPRQLRVVAQRDYLWVRLLDVPAALAARGYRVDGELVLEVVDALRPEVDGRYRLTALRGTGLCARTDDPPDLVLGVAELSSLYLGGVDATALARAGRVVERTPGALVRADDLFGWPVRPLCTTRF